MSHWLEVLIASKDGIFDALSKNVLASLQFSIILDKEKPSEIIESYTFTLKYTRNPETSSRQLVGLTVLPSGGGPITFVDVRSGLKTIWKHLSHTVERLPELPRTVHWFHDRYSSSDISQPNAISPYTSSILMTVIHHTIHHCLSRVMILRFWCHTMINGR